MIMDLVFNITDEAKVIIPNYDSRIGNVEKIQFIYSANDDSGIGILFTMEQEQMTELAYVIAKAVKLWQAELRK